ncbi:MAG: BPL-N domain-containing protein [Alphaproteobacteria bacterium]|jgi:glutamine amidotransferase-like uncharacterized protein|nr:BPL-N domain-containing protein [Alphaproteobacteria bacterium]
MKVYLYKDKGCLPGRDIQTQEWLERHIQNVEVTKVSAEQIKNGILNDNPIAFVMPGGNVKGFIEALGAEGSAKIKEYISDGGLYYGICAGATYACRSFYYHNKTTGEKIQKHENTGELLGVCAADTTAYPDRFINKEYLDNGCQLILEYGNKELVQMFYRKGPYFFNLDKNIKVHGVYKEMYDEEPVCVGNDYGKGKVFISGTHPEYASKHLIEQGNLIFAENIYVAMDEKQKHLDLYSLAFLSEVLKGE